MRNKFLIKILLIIMVGVMIMSGCSILGMSNEATQTPVPTVIPIRPREELGRFTTFTAYNGNYYFDELDIAIEYIIADIANEYDVILDCDVRFIKDADFNDTVNKTLAAGEAVDGISGRYELLVEYTKYPYLLMDIEPLLEQYGKNIIEKISHDDMLGADIGGKIVGLADVGLTNEYYTIIRSDLLQEMGQEIPTDMNTLMNVCENAKKAGISTPIALTLQQIKRTWSASYSLPNGLFAQGDGTVWPMEYHPYYKTFVKQIEEMYDEGYLTKDFASAIYEEQEEKFEQGKALIWETTNNDAYQIYNKLISSDTNARISVLPNPKVEGYSKSSYIGENSQTPDAVWFLTCGHASKALMVFKDYTYKSQENYLNIKYGAKDVHYELSAAQNSIVYPLMPYELSRTYNGELMLNSGLDKLYPPIKIKNAQGANQYANKLSLEAYNYISNSIIVESGITKMPIVLSKAANNAMLEYKRELSQAEMEFIQGNIDYTDLDDVLDNMVDVVRIWCDEVGTA